MTHSCSNYVDDGQTVFTSNGRLVLKVASACPDGSCLNSGSGFVLFAVKLTSSQKRSWAIHVRTKWNNMVCEVFLPNVTIPLTLLNQLFPDR